VAKDYNELALAMHRKNRGKIAVHSKVPVKNRDDLSIAYTPGVARPCLLWKPPPPKHWRTL